MTDSTCIGLLPDERLDSLNALQSVRAVSVRLESDRRYSGFGRDSALAMASPGLIDNRVRWGDGGSTFVDDSGQHPGSRNRKQDQLHKMRIAGLVDAEAAAEGNGAYSTGDRLTCAISILAFHEEPMPGVFERAQRLVSDTLLRYPVLLHPHLVMPVRQPGDTGVRWMSVLTGMVLTKRAELPSARHGVDPARLQAFAVSPHLLGAFTAKVPADVGYIESGRRASTGYAGLGFEAAVQSEGYASPGFLASLFELARWRAGRLRSDQRWPTLPHRLGMQSSLRDSVLAGLFASAGLQVRRDSFTAPMLAPRHAALLDELVGHPLWGMPQLSEWAVKHLERAIFCDPWIRRLGQPAPTQGVPAEVVAHNARATFEALMHVGLHASELEAAQWVCELLVGEGRRRSQTLPPVHVEGAMGFLQALASAGAELPRLPRDHELGARSQPGAVEHWQIAHVAVTRCLEMKAVVANRAPAPTNNQPPARRLRAV